MSVVDFLVVGAMKSGTTSLHKYLSSHEQLFLPKKKELNYFAIDEEFEKGLSYYQNNFPTTTTRMCGEVSPRYMMSEKAPERIRQEIGDVKIIMIVRNPIERAFSHFRMMQRRNEEIRTWPEWVLQVSDGRENRNTSDYIKFGLYGQILHRYLQYFDYSSVHILFTDELEREPKEAMKNIAKFLEIENKFSDAIIGKKYHSSGNYRFPSLTKLINKASKTLAPHKSIVFKFIPRNLASSALFYFETQLNVVSDGSYRVKESEIEVLKMEFSDDLMLFEKLSGIRQPWFS